VSSSFEENQALLSFLDNALSQSQIGTLLATFDKELKSEGPQSLPPLGGPTIEPVSARWRKIAVSSLRSYKSALFNLPPSMLKLTLRLLATHRTIYLKEAFGTETVKFIQSGGAVYDLDQLNRCLRQHLK